MNRVALTVSLWCSMSVRAEMPVFKGVAVAPYSASSTDCSPIVKKGSFVASAYIDTPHYKIEIYSGLMRSDQVVSYGEAETPVYGFSIKLIEPASLAVIGHPTICQWQRCFGPFLTYVSEYCTPGVLGYEKVDPIDDGSVDLDIERKKRCVKFFFKNLSLEDLEVRGVALAANDWRCGLNIEFRSFHIDQ